MMKLYNIINKISKKLNNKYLRLFLDILWKLEDIYDKVFPDKCGFYISCGAEDEMNRRNSAYRLLRLYELGRAEFISNTKLKDKLTGEIYDLEKMYQM